MTRQIPSTLFLALFSALLIGCTVLNPAPSPTPVVSTLPPTIPSPPTAPPRNLLVFSDSLNDSRRLPDGVACLPDYLDITQAAIARMDNGGLQIRFNLAVAVPDRVESGNHGFDFFIYLGDDIVRPVAQFRALAAGLQYTALYTTTDIPLQPDPGFTIQIADRQLVMTIQPTLLVNLPASVTASLKTFYCPPAGQFCCDDYATPGRSFPLSLR